MLRQECPASLFEREAEVLFGALKTKSCLSEASSFCLAQKSAGVAQKVQTAVFLFCYLFLSADRKKKVRIIPTKPIKLQQYIRTAVYKKDA